MEENGKVLRFVYHKGELVYERGEREQTGTSYHQGAGTEALNRAGKIYYYHKDEQLSTAFITDEQGAIKNTYRYDAFGNTLDSTEQIENRIRYTGQQYDGITGQYYLRARYYNPAVGRFMQEDTYRGDGLNLYAYCANNPVTYCDPSGYAGTSSYVAADGGDGGDIKDIYDPEKIAELYSDLPTKVIIPEEYKDKPEVYLNKGDSIILRDQLNMSGVDSPRFPNQTHHVVPINQAPEAIAYLESLGIEGNSAANGVFLPSYVIEGNPQVTHSVQSSGMMRHGTEYIEDITTDILSAKTQAEGVAVLEGYRNGLLDGSITNLYKDKE